MNCMIGIHRGLDNYSKQSPLSVLLFCDDNHGQANTVLDHIRAFGQFSRHRVVRFNPCGLKGSHFLNLNEFDAVVIHYSINIVSNWHLPHDFRKKLRCFQGLKVQFIQDEYRWVDRITTMMRYLDIHILFTCVPPAEIPKIYGDHLPDVVKVPTLTGYAPDHLVGIETPPIESRPIDIGYRGRTLPYWLGRLAQEKVWIAQGVLERAQEFGLRCDIAWTEMDRIYGKKWIKFISSCKATLGTESGASITDFDGSIEAKVKEYIATYPDADFDDVRRDLLDRYEGNVNIHVISPRVFEAAALHTAMILFPGEYSGIVKPWVHYIPLQKDFSNMGEVVERLHDLDFIRSMTTRAYDDLVASGKYSFRAFIREFDEVLSQYGHAGRRRKRIGYVLARAEVPVVAPVPFAARQLSKTPLRNLVWQLPRALVAARLILGIPELRSILIKYLLDGHARKSIRPLLLFDDLLKLGLILQARRGSLPTNTAFGIRTRFDARSGELRFDSISLHDDEDNVRPGSCRIGLISGDLAILEKAMFDGGLKSIRWNHSTVGSVVPYNMTKSRQTTISLGNYGIHQFAGLIEMSKCFPQSVYKAVLPLLSDR